MNKNPVEDPLHSYVVAWRGHVERQISEANAVPDLIGVYERSRRWNPEEIGERDSEESDIYSDVFVEMDDGSLHGSDPGRGEADLAPFYQDWKTRIDRDCDQILRNNVSNFDPSRPSDKQRWKRRLVLSFCMAAAVAGVWLLPQIQRFGPMLQSQTIQAQHSVNLADRPMHQRNTHARHFTAAKPSFFEEVNPKKSQPLDLSFLGDVKISLDHAPVKFEGEVDQEKTGLKQNTLSENKIVSNRSRESRLRALDRQARELWKQGKIDRAQENFQRLTKIGGRTKLAELAFGDLFAITREYSEPKRMRALWTQYLRKFPNGVFSQDARAGLCRIRQSGKQMQACWHEYLQKHPSGAHYQEARLHAGGISAVQK